jgi:hypothetical protein
MRWHVARKPANVNRPKAKLGLPELDHSRGAVLNSLRSQESKCGGELQQMQFLLGHVSDQTTERYLAGKQRINGAVNDKIGIEP